MLDERTRRRPGFRSGLELHLVDGQVWSLPVPDGEASRSETPLAAWDDANYRAILEAVMDAGNSGDLFRAEFALMVHLLRWNYALDGADLGELFADQGENRHHLDLEKVLHNLTLAHLGPSPGPLVGRPRRGFFSRKDEMLRLINAVASRLVARRRDHETGASADLTT